MSEAIPLRHVDLDQIEEKMRQPAAKTFADLVDETATSITALLLSMDQADKALRQIEATAAAILEKAKPARTLIEAVRASAQK